MTLVDVEMLVLAATFAVAMTSFSSTRRITRRWGQEINVGWTDSDRAFLLGFKQGTPDWNLFHWENLSHMGAVQWKLLNIQKPMKQNLDKHAEQSRALEERLGA